METHASATRLPKRDNGLRSILVLFLLVVLGGVGSRGAEVAVSTAGEVAAAAALAQAGDTIVMRDGVWLNADVLFSSTNGTAARPITLRAQTLGRVQLTGTSRLRLAG